MNSRLAIFALLVLPVYIYAQSSTPPLSTDRPDLTEAPDVGPLHFFQLETGIVLEKDKPESYVAMNSYSFATTLLRYGLAEGIELRLSGAFLREDIQDHKGISSEAGLADIGIGAKFHLLEENGIVPQAGLITVIDFPVGDKFFTEDEIIPGVVFAAAHNVTEWASLSYNLGARYRKDQNSLYNYSLAMGIQPLKKIGVYAEIFGFIKKTSTPVHAFDLGMTYLVLSNLQLDTSYGLAISDIAADSFFNFGLSWRLPR